MPLYSNAIDKIRVNLCKLAQGERATYEEIGYFTEQQFKDINQLRLEKGLPTLECNEILYMGRHHYTSRSKDGYQIEDLIKQIKSALSEYSEVDLNNNRGTVLENPNKRQDGYGNLVNDRAVLELTAKKPRAELFSVIPKGDHIKP
ncbi:hypothetical protein A1D22_04575 [Pasteurellaceae bacterium LFhippo2]|nr:hypothetical protein [Pasteurellaceae bacterium LFhippo2]